uniref:AIG1-type G domain-containing protein n=1 Tax=Poecilia latipinna TaxID=48699 RepID=A0A3B3VSX8_9TELE
INNNNVINNYYNVCIPPDHLRIVMIGGSLAGKSSTGNHVLEKYIFNVDKNGYRTTTRSEISHGVVEGRRLTVVDSPGWFYINTLQETNEVLHSVSMCSPGPHVFLLLVPILRSFTEKDLKALVEIMKPLTERVWRHCMVVFTWGNWINDVPVENYIIREGKEIQELLEKCGNRYHVINPKSSDYSVQVKELFQKIIDMVKQTKKCFNKGKENKLWILPLQAKQIEKEWNRREQELIERMMKALAKEPEESTEPPFLHILDYIHCSLE